MPVFYQCKARRLWAQRTIVQLRGVQLLSSKTISQIQFIMFILFLLLASAVAAPRQLQTVRQVIVIGAGAAGIGASLTLTQNNIDHLILQARDRIGGRVWAGPLGTSFTSAELSNTSSLTNRTNGTSGNSTAGQGIDLGASFVLNSDGPNLINDLALSLNWASTQANFSKTQIFYQRPDTLSPEQQALAMKVYQNFVGYATDFVSSEGDNDVQTVWNRYLDQLNGSAINNTIVVTQPSPDAQDEQPPFLTLGDIIGQAANTTNNTNGTIFPQNNTILPNNTNDTIPPIVPPSSANITPVVIVYNETTINRAYFQVALTGSFYAADLSQLSTAAFLNIPSIVNAAYLPAGSYAQLLTAIFQSYSNNTQILYNEFVNLIDYSGPVVRMVTQNQNVYFANRVISSIPLGLLQARNVTFIPALPAQYQAAIDSIGNGVFNKIILNFDRSFWNTNIDLLEFVNAVGQPNRFPDAYVYPDTNNNILVFYTWGNTSRILNGQTDAQIVSTLVGLLPEFLNTNTTIQVSNLYTVTRWEQDVYALGAYSYYPPNVTAETFSILTQPIDDKLWLVGEHTHPNQSATVHGAFQTGVWAVSTNYQLWVMSIWVLLIIFASS